MGGRTRRFLLAGAAASLAAPAAFAQSTRRNRTFERALVIDACGGAGNPADEPGDAGFKAQDLLDVRESGVTALNLTISAVGNSPTAWEETLDGIAWMEREMDAHPSVFLKVRNGSDLLAAKRAGKLGVIYGFQDTWLLGPNLERMPMVANLGVKIIQLTYNKRNLVGDGCLEPADAGLSVFGRELVADLNARKILVDLSHGGARTIREGIAASTAPPAITHTGCRALVDVPRNVNDETLRALAEKGGVMGVYFMPFIRASGQPVAADALAHIEHAINVAGEDHVGIGTDALITPYVVNDAFRERHRQFVEERQKRGISAPGEAVDVYNFVTEYNHVRRFERLANDLEARGHPPRRVEKILGGNFARLFTEVWG